LGGMVIVRWLREFDAPELQFDDPELLDERF
jgi:hypothetical protein